MSPANQRRIIRPINYFLRIRTNITVKYKTAYNKIKLLKTSANAIRNTEKKNEKKTETRYYVTVHGCRRHSFPGCRCPRHGVSGTNFAAARVTACLERTCAPRHVCTIPTRFLRSSKNSSFIPLPSLTFCSAWEQTFVIAGYFNLMCNCACMYSPTYSRMTYEGPVGSTSFKNS